MNRCRVSGAAVPAVVVLATAAVLAVAPQAAHASTGGTSTITGVVTDPSGRALSGVAVRSGEAIVDTDAEGHYTLSGLPAGSRIRVCAVLRPDQGYGGAAGLATTCATVALTAGGTTSAPLRMTPGSAVSGTVHDARTGRPVAGRALVLDSTVYFSTVTDTAGRYVLRNLTPGTTYGVRTAAGDGVGPDAPHGYAAGLTPGAVIALRPRQVFPLDVIARPLVQFSGRVTDAGGAAVPFAALDVVLGADDTIGYAGPDGEYAILRQWSEPPTVCASGPATASAPTGLALTCVEPPTSGVSVTTDVTLSVAGASLTGRVAPTDHTFMVTVQVRAGAVTNRVTFVGSTIHGVYRLDGLPRGTFVVRASDNTPDGETVALSSGVRAVPGTVTTVPTIRLSTG